MECRSVLILAYILNQQQNQWDGRFLEKHISVQEKLT